MPEVWTVKKILDWTSGYFSESKIPEPRLSAELLLAHVLECTRISLYVQFERILTSKERDRFREFVKRRVVNEPVQYILGETEFMGYPFQVDPGVLIPRPDSEHLVDRVLEYCGQHQSSQYRILDLGTGSGCLAVSLAKKLPAAEIVAIDNQEDALSVAEKNAVLNEVTVHFLKQDICNISPTNEQPFDIIISNPPYIRQEEWEMLHPQVRDFEPRAALIAEEDGLFFYREIVRQTPGLLTNNGRVFLEVGYDQSAIVQKLWREIGFDTHAHRDYQQIERVIEAWKS